MTRTLQSVKASDVNSEVSSVCWAFSVLVIERVFHISAGLPSRPHQCSWSGSWWTSVDAGKLTLGVVARGHVLRLLEREREGERRPEGGQLNESTHRCLISQVQMLHTLLNSSSSWYMNCWLSTSVFTLLFLLTASLMSQAAFEQVHKSTLWGKTQLLSQSGHCSHIWRRKPLGSLWQSSPCLHHMALWSSVPTHLISNKPWKPLPVLCFHYYCCFFMLHLYSLSIAEWNRTWTRTWNRTTQQKMNILDWYFSAFTFKRGLVTRALSQSMMTFKRTKHPNEGRYTYC